MPSAPTITFDVRTSRWVPALVAVLVLLCLLALELARIPWWTQLGAALGVLGYAWLCLRAEGRQRVAVARWRGDGNWLLELADGAKVPARLDGARVLGPVIFLRFSWSKGSCTNVSLWPDNADPDTRRRLRARLRAAFGG